MAKTKGGCGMRVRLKIKEVAKAKKMSQYRLAKLSDVAPNRLRLYYHDPFTNVTSETLGRLAAALQVDASELIESVPDAEE
jgi:transcriptional regulator with XRE-family HTH domain